MASNVNGKIYTDNALMDEIVHQTKIILRNIILKNETTANEHETEESITESDYYIACKNGSMEISFFPFTVEWLMDYGYDIYDATVYASDWTQIPEEDRDDLMDYSINRYINEYVEKNDYYRMLNGKPAYGTTEYDIYLNPADPRLLEDDDNTDFNYTIPIHEFGSKQINTLKSLNIISDMIEEHKGDIHYKYLNFLGGTSIDVYTARVAANWDILFMPNCENLIKNRFKEIYAINKTIYLNRVYQDAYAFMSDYYDEMTMVMCLTETFANMIAEIPEWYIRRDIFDLRSAQYFLESQGVKFFREIPLKYQIRLVKNLNRLIKYKSTDQNMHDILEVFGMENTTVYKYYIYKDYLPADSPKYDGIDEYGHKFKLAFVQVPIDEPYDKYIQNNMYLKDYDVVTEVDEYWDGVLSHELVKERHGEKDFSIEGTKYMFLDYNVDMLKYRFQLSYFMGMIFNSTLYTEDVNLVIPEISETNYYSLTDLCILLCCLSGPYKSNKPTPIHIPLLEDEGEWIMDDVYDFGDEEVDDIFYDPALSSSKKYDFGYNYTVDPELPYERYDFLEEQEGEETVHSQATIDYFNHVTATLDDEDVTVTERNDSNTNEDWLTRKYSYLWTYTKWMIYGFNLHVDLEELEKNISMRHSAFGFYGEYHLSDFGCDTFITADRIDTIEEFNNIYMTNKACYDSLMDFMTNKCDTRDKAVVAQYVFDNLFLTKYDLEFYRLKTGEIASTYVELLKERSYSLYRFYIEITREPDPEIQKDGIRVILNTIVSTLEYFIGNQKELQYIFSFVPTNSSEAIVHYLSLILNFFKSWKVHFLDPAASYTIADRYDDKAKFYEQVAEMKYKYWKDDQNSTRDSFKTTVKLFAKDDRYTFLKEIMDIYGYFDQDPEFNNVYDGWYPESTSTDINDANGGIVNDCIPFRMVNGGTPFGIRIFDTITVDGGPAYDQHEYADINGYDISDPNWKQILTNDLQPVGYPIFGGFPGKLWSDSLRTNISSDLIITNDTRLNSYTINNGLTFEMDGLYFGNGIGDYVPGTAYAEFKVVMDWIDGELIPRAYIYLETIKLFSSHDYMHNEIDREYQRFLKPILDIEDPEHRIFIEYDFDKEMKELFLDWLEDVWPFYWHSF